MALANASPELLWGIVKDTSCFLMKQKYATRSGHGKAGVHLTKEANNLKGVNSFKFSGLANAKTLGITAAADGKGIVLTKKVTKAERALKPSKLYATTTWTAKHKDFRRVAKAIKAETEGKYYRSDLTSTALAKWSLLYASQKKKA